MSTDRIEKVAELRAPVSRVWRALTDAAQFGEWFRVKLDGAFTPGQPIRGKITQPGYEHVTMEVWVEAIEPETYFSFRWRPYAIDPAVDYSHEPRTLVEFRLSPTPAGTRLAISESGFDGIPASRRDEAFRMNERGWAAQLENVSRYVSGT
ncbi:MAG: SRPBCC family protein [Polyangiaceae bacterium]